MWSLPNILNQCGYSKYSNVIHREDLKYPIGFGLTVSEESDREESFTTIRIRRKDKADLEKIALPREALWATVKRLKESYMVERMSKRN